MKTIQPIAADKIQEYRDSMIPDQVIDIFNKLIARNFDGKTSVFLKADVEREINNCEELASDFQDHWLDVSHAFQKAGWKVQFEQPDLGVKTQSKFIFSTVSKKTQ